MRRRGWCWGVRVERVVCWDWCWLWVLGLWLAPSVDEEKAQIVKAKNLNDHWTHTQVKGAGGIPASHHGKDTNTLLVEHLLGMSLPRRLLLHSYGGLQRTTCMATTPPHTTTVPARHSRSSLHLGSYTASWYNNAHWLIPRLFDVKSSADAIQDLLES